MITSNIDSLLANADLTPDSMQGEALPIEAVEKEPVSLEPQAEVAEIAEEVAPEVSETETDDYGTTIEKKPEKVYTESEVQQMIRDRLSRGQNKQVEPPVQQQTANEDSGDWESQLESFVEQTLTKREQKFQQEQWEHNQQLEQANFEIKFNSGAAKYGDFGEVVMGKALTPQMVSATKGMSDPAAFIYAAAKTQAGELERISKISDPMSQAVEIGKLEERMKRSRSTTSSAPKPIAAVKGDSVEKVKPRNVDDILMAEDRARRR